MEPMPEKLQVRDASGARWSPNGRRIAYWTYWYEIQGQRDLMTIPAEGGTPTPVINDGPTDWDPIWSPDGSWLYHVDAYRLISPAEAEELDLELIRESGPMVIEWADQIKTVLPNDRLWIRLWWMDDEQRFAVLHFGIVD